LYRNVLLYGINATLKADCKCLFDPVILFIIFIPSEQIVLHIDCVDIFLSTWVN